MWVVDDWSLYAPIGVLKLQCALEGDWDVPHVRERQAQTKVDRGSDDIIVRLQQLAIAQQHRREKRGGVHAAT